ncbi:bifunctional DNA-formamidopyrimidine glycosylase/DNA-(apurinic or apyrimidinic site) lyase [Methylobacillus flagellatus]|uniref:Formamidopyrimidine-DNA glycosylase n=1 Tax=Methylobacillus flagellatus (strain ATCC 51484 / DSM 6875 / VKM B-1610 / KT) TaxID=265072 RepID=FPG_METFK|nr:bifunctional DNA-formamidopyrimidine glycosylase/DNA-(apurinic or apyrimidinic site) lyase [Methylobacillus flagellatus]Q1H3I3.1 RecName: Full=Formamidopyrimidine-DNA glycosylase; Short=Fapy-DNA glycosylase; AltName: Full=DNA-(apurinic or apyrimidinic site) lyase MutM; Short=AP lyase MutM [Methylobacillus flagellatus KT]ABE48954.1 Formamidopyrimidine-DNA glycosylase / DNA-(apurinic or apyrimidinic site) lyase [Methylobacillus flagellatus KT]
MPELPEVEVTRRGLEPLIGATVTQAVIRQPAMRWPIPSHLPQVLHGARLLELRRRGKYIIARFESGCLILHLGMSGRLCLLESDTFPEKHDHFDLHFADGRVMRMRDPRRFGAVLWAGDQPDEHSLLKVLGQEPLDEAFNGEFLQQAIRTRSSPIKTVIMDSHLVVGVGNIYASESLFRAGIHPETPARALTLAQCRRLVEEVKLTLQDALQAGGSSLRDFFGADGNPGYFQQTYFVYGRTGQPCRVCQTPIAVLRLGQRSTFYCPACQQGQPPSNAMP